MNIEDRNFYNDHRTRAAQRGSMWSGYDKRKSELEVEIDDGETEETFRLPAKLVACPTCLGRGRYVNPSIDASGLTRDDMGPDFVRDYRRGVYDVTCAACEGKRVVPVVDEDALDEDDRKVWDRFIKLEDDRSAYEAECRAERMMGA